MSISMDPRTTPGSSLRRTWSHGPRSLAASLLVLAACEFAPTIEGDESEVDATATSADASPDAPPGDPDAEPGTDRQIPCGDQGTCSETCCVTTVNMTDTYTCDVQSCSGDEYLCDGDEDCSNGRVCCVDSSGSRCMDSDDCRSGDEHRTCDEPDDGNCNRDTCRDDYCCENDDDVPFPICKEDD